MEATAPATVLSRCDHSVSPKRFSDGARKVLYRLNRKGHKACLVGGSVRDLLLERKPKDYDIVTDARPEEVRRLFRNSRIIGRRFRLVHVLFGDGVVEVSTFRAAPDPDDQRRAPGELLVTSDNTWGTPRQDAFRRDFTINALLFRASDQAIVDYVGGIEDLEQGRLRMIGDPEVRCREDPVRMVRACEFAARFDFDIHEPTLQAAVAHRHEIDKASPHRLIEELIELLASGRSAATFDWMARIGLLPLILPEVSEVHQADGEPNGFGALAHRLDERVQRTPALPVAVLLSTLLLPRIVVGRERLEVRDGHVHRRRLLQLVDDVVADMGSRFAISAARRRRMKMTLDAFQRLCEEPRRPKAIQGLLRREDMPAALELFALLVAATGTGMEALATWQQRADDTPAGAPTGAMRRRRRRRRRPRRRQL